MKPNKPNFWIIIAAIYLVIYCSVILIYKPDFLDIESCLLLIPLYAMLVIALNIIHKDDEDNNKALWSIKWALICVTAIVVIVKIVAGYYK